MNKKPGLGRIFAPDARDSRFPLRALVSGIVPVVRSRHYATGPVLDQGSTPQCVAFAWKQWIDSLPIRGLATDPPEPNAIYRLAQALDEWAGTPHDGSSVRAGAKVMQNLGKLGAYHWSESVEDVRDYLLTTSTVVLGTNWYEGMFTPDKETRVKLTGQIAGGHAYLCIGYSNSRGAFRCLNSWGASWGHTGRFWIAGEDLRRLLQEDGEACAGAEIKV